MNRWLTLLIFSFCLEGITTAKNQPPQVVMWPAPGGSLKP
jgi:hypothetical protein